jgi:hypothetical protein
LRLAVVANSIPAGASNSAEPRIGLAAINFAGTEFFNIAGSIPAASTPAPVNPAPVTVIEIPEIAGVNCGRSVAVIIAIIIVGAVP